MNALIIFIKNPVKGQVKTRIARTVGDDCALEIYLKLSKITRENVLILRGVTIYVFYSDFIETNDDWSNEHFEKQVQTGNDLGERMFNAFDFVFKKHNSVCIIGSDCPTLSATILQEAFDKLNAFDCVLGPSTDGGYYLLGIKNNINSVKNKIFSFTQSLRSLFDTIVWSTETVLSETLERMKKNHQTVSLLPALTDIDEETDWLNFQKTAKLTNGIST